MISTTNEYRLKQYKAKAAHCFKLAMDFEKIGNDDMAELWLSKTLQYEEAITLILQNGMAITHNINFEEL